MIRVISLVVVVPLAYLCFSMCLVGYSSLPFFPFLGSSVDLSVSDFSALKFGVRKISSKFDGGNCTAN